MSYPPRKQLKTTSGPVSIFPKEQNLFGYRNLKLQTDRQMDRQTNKMRGGFFHGGFSRGCVGGYPTPFIGYCLHNQEVFLFWGSKHPQPPRKQLETTTGPVCIFPEEQNPIGSAVTEILSYRQTPVTLQIMLQIMLQK